MRSLFIGISLVVSVTVFSQSRNLYRTPISNLPNNQLIPALNAGFGFGDLNGDGTVDVIVSGCGTRNYNFITTAIYFNDGNGNLNKSANDCLPAANGQDIHIWDVDGDNDNDLLLTGLVNGNSAELYLNDGNGGFTRSDSAPFAALPKSGVAVGDLNGDNINDVLITGQITAGAAAGECAIYLGNAHGKFTRQANNLDGFFDADVEIGDIDRDGKMDVVMVGIVNGTPTTRAFKNLGNLNFSAFSFTLPQLRGDNGNYNSGLRPCVKLDYINADSYLDIALIGQDASQNPHTAILLSNFGTSFSEITIPALTNFEDGEIHLLDLTNDGKLDILATGRVSHYTPRFVALEQTNTGWAPLPDIEIPVMTLGMSAVHDINGDGKKDFFIGGTLRPSNYNPGHITACHFNLGNGTLPRTDGSQFDGIYGTSHVVGDLDADGDLDFIAIGKRSTGQKRTRAFYNNGDNTFTEDTVVINYASGNYMTLFTLRDLHLAYVNNDAYIDLIASNTFRTKIEVLLGGSTPGTFTSSASYNEYEYIGGLKVDDINGDGYIDYSLLTPFQYNGPYEMSFMLGNASGTFSQLTLSNPPIIEDPGNVHYFDYDHDGDKDFFSVIPLAYSANSALFEWTGSEYVARSSFNIPNTPRDNCHTVVADFNGDGYTDIIMIGDTTGATGGGVCRLITLDSTGLATVHHNIGMPRLEAGFLDTADFDLDGDMDILLTGLDDDNKFQRGVFLNDGTGHFSNAGYENMAHTFYNSWFMDMDEDGDPDVIQCGWDYNQNVNIGYALENIIVSPQSFTSSISTCSPYTWPITGCTYNQSGVYVVEYEDSAHNPVTNTLNLTFDGVEAVVNQIIDSTLYSLHPYSSYQWYNCDSGFIPLVNDTGRYFIPTHAGNYSVVVSNGICSDTSTCVQWNALSIPLIHKQTLVLAPNPTEGDVLVEGLEDEASFSVFDIRGTTVSQGSLNKEKNAIHLGTLPPGVYVIQLIQQKESTVYIERIIVQ